MTKSDCPLCVAKRTYYAEAADFRLVPLTDVRAVRGAPARTIVALILCPTETDGRRFVGKQYQAV